MIAGIVMVVTDDGRIDQRADSVPIVDAARFGIGPLGADYIVDGDRHAQPVVRHRRDDRLVRVPVVVAVLFGGQAHKDRGPVNGGRGGHDRPLAQGVGTLFHHHFHIGHLVQHFGKAQGGGRHAVGADKNHVFGLRTGRLGSRQHYGQRQENKEQLLHDQASKSTITFMQVSRFASIN